MIMCTLITLLHARRQPMRNPPIKIDAVEKFSENKNKETREKANTIFNEVRQFAYVLGTREIEILLIQQPIQLYLACNSRGQGDPSFLGNLIEFNSNS